MTTVIESGSQEEENQDVQEILEDLLIRMLTREYVDVSTVVTFILFHVDKNLISLSVWLSSSSSLKESCMLLE